MNDTNWEERFREHFRSIYFGKDDFGTPQYAPEAVIDEAIAFFKSLSNQSNEK